jgi:hypothetical protein
MKRQNAMEPSYLQLLLAFAVPATQLATQFAAQFLTEPAPPTDGGVFLSTREIGHQRTVERMYQLPARGTVGIGTSALFNLELFVARHEMGVTDWILVDPAPEVQNFWRKVQSVFAEASDLENAFALLEKAISQDRSPYFSEAFLFRQGRTNAEIFAERLRLGLDTAKERLLLSMKEMSYLQLKSLVTEHLILIPTDLTNLVATKKLLAYIGEHNLKIDSLYVSNVWTHLSEEALRPFRACVEALRQNSATENPAYLIEALPSPEPDPSVCKKARALAQKSYQHIFEDPKVE